MPTVAIYHLAPWGYGTERRGGKLVRMYKLKLNKGRRGVHPGLKRRCRVCCKYRGDHE